MCHSALFTTQEQVSTTLRKLENYQLSIDGHQFARDKRSALLEILDKLDDHGADHFGTEVALPPFEIFRLAPTIVWTVSACSVLH